MRFENPWYLILLLVLVLFFYKKSKQSFLFNIHLNLKNNPQSFKMLVSSVIPFLRSLIFTFFVIALANPQKINEKVKKQTEGIDIMIVLDTSDSMRSEDFQPDNRFEVAKNVIKNFIKNRDGDKIGLITFSGESYTKCPLTTDYQVLNQRLDETQINTGEIKQGTAIGMAIANGVARFKDSKTKTKIMVLLSDGENNTGVIDPITASELASDKNIKIYSIAIGKDGKVPYPVTSQNFFGNPVKQYAYINNKLNTEIFTKISEITKGSFYRATDSDALKKIFDKIDKLEKSKVSEQKLIKVKDYFYVFIYWGFILFLINIFLEYFYIRSLPL